MDRLLVSDCLSLMLADYVYQYEQTLLYVCSEPCSKYMVLRQVFPYDCFHLGPWGARSTRAPWQPSKNAKQLYCIMCKYTMLRDNLNDYEPKVEELVLCCLFMLGSRFNLKRLFSTSPAAAASE